MTELVYGRVPYPEVTPSHLAFANPYVQDGAPDIAEAMFWHRMIGSWNGTDIWFHGGHAATAYGVAVAAIDGDNAGRIYEWISRESGWYGESSGPARDPYGDGARLIAKVGVNGVNRTTKAIEISGDVGTPLDEPAREAIVALTAYFADRKRIPWSEFPNVPGEDRSFVCWHNEITGLVYKTCPGWLVMQETPALIARVAQRLKQYQTETAPTKPPVYAPSELPEWFARTLEQARPSDARVGDVLYRTVRRNVEALKRTQRYSAPSTKAKKSGPPVEVREKVFVERLFVDADKRQWFLTDDGHYVVSSGFNPRIQITAR